MIGSRHLVLFIFAVCVTTSNTNAVEDQKYWEKLGQEDIKAALASKINDGIAKNVILFVGDGLGLTTITASRIYGETEKGYLAFEKFPHLGALKTYSANIFVPDSSSTATAMFCGTKANQKTSGVDASVTEGDCEASLRKESQVDSILKWAQDAGKSTGFVTTTRVTHATPSALYVHTPKRAWECEATMPQNASKCKDIARQLIEDEPGKNIQVIMGGGRQCLQSNINGSEQDPIDTWACYSKDGRDLINQWKHDKMERNLTHSVLNNNADLQNVNINTDFVLGIFANGHLKMDYERDRGPTGMPSLMNMTEKAIQILQKYKEGYVLVVEGGLIDFAHHRGFARKALDETIAFSTAIAKAVELTKHQASETLIIVTSDHSHSLVFSGYADRTKSVLDVAQDSKMDGMGYTSLLYGTGGPDNYQYYVENNSVTRRDPKNSDTTSYTYAQQAAILTDEVTHSGSDVLVYATGPMSHLFYAVHEQTYVAYVISYAAKIGPFKKSNSANIIQNPVLVTIIVCVRICICFM